MQSSFDIIRTLLVTEKGTSLLDQHKYIFKVDPRANKVDIKKAVEEVYKVNVMNVNTMNMPRKFKRLRHKGGYTSQWKKAIVTLKAGDKIEMAH